MRSVTQMTKAQLLVHIEELEAELLDAQHRNTKLQHAASNAAAMLRLGHNSETPKQRSFVFQTLSERCGL